MNLVPIGSEDCRLYLQVQGHGWHYSKSFSLHKIRNVESKN